MPSVSNLVQLQITPEQAKEICAQVGWCDIDEAWAYASATTITVPTDATTRFQKGDKIRLTQPTAGVKYFYIIAVAATTLTINPNTSYSIANEAISSISYSRADEPFGFPAYFSYVPASYGGFTGAVTTTAAFYKIRGQICYLYLSFTGTGDTSGNCQVTGPIAHANTAEGVRFLGCVQDSTWQADPGMGAFRVNATTADIYKTITAAAWSNSVAKSFKGFVEYPI